MSLVQILEKFAEGFSVRGIFLQTATQTFPIIQQKADSLLLIKRHPNLQIGINKLRIKDDKIGVLVDSLDDETNIIIVTAYKHVKEVAAHWKRFSPVIQKQIQIEEYIHQESIETKLINQLEDIRIALSTSTTLLKEKINYGSK
ncbi:MAG: hypothetical protein JSV04_13605 [Candidatus Heimdallarchaeota archaeon]|nr:MAG: hypothetical protein JSV04_13605 [Candidatus Heimdallarchaeota archaeon]